MNPSPNVAAMQKAFQIKAKFYGNTCFFSRDGPGACEDIKKITNPFCYRTFK
jgi:hypothetical protein